MRYTHSFRSDEQGPSNERIMDTASIWLGWTKACLHNSTLGSDESWTPHSLVFQRKYACIKCLIQPCLNYMYVLWHRHFTSHTRTLDYSLVPSPGLRVSNHVRDDRNNDSVSLLFNFIVRMFSSCIFQLINSKYVFVFKYLVYTSVTYKYVYADMHTNIFV